MEELNTEAKPSRYVVQRLFITIDEASSEVRIFLRCVSDGSMKEFVWRGKEAEDMVVALNRANFSVVSMHRTIFELLIAEGKISGTIAGQPDGTYPKK